MGDLPDGWANYSYKGFAIRKRTDGGRIIWKDGTGQTCYDHSHPKYVRYLVMRHGVVVDRFITMKGARAWIRAQRQIKKKPMCHRFVTEGCDCRFEKGCSL